jgi:hypothetical protein
LRCGLAEPAAALRAALANGFPVRCATGNDIKGRVLDIISDPVFYAAAVPGVLLAGVAKGGFSGGVGMFGTLILALVVPPIQAAAIMLPILA